MKRRVRAILGTSLADQPTHVVSGIDYTGLAIDTDASRGLTVPPDAFLCYISVDENTRAVPVHGLGVPGWADVIWCVDGSVFG
jgi:hypothetical protein